MKPLIVIVFLLVAQCANAQPKKVSRDENCTRYMDLAEMVMRHRQQGVNIKIQLDAVADLTRKSNAATQSALRALVFRAYKMVPYIGDEWQERGSREFATQAYIECMGY